MAHFHTFIPSESGFDYSNIDAEDFWPNFINEMQEIENYTDRKVEKEFNKKMDEQWEEERFTVSRQNFWDTYEPVRNFLDEGEFNVEQKRAILMFLYERDAILRKIEIGDWSYSTRRTQNYVGSNIRYILSKREILKRSVSEKKAKAKKKKARKKEEADNKIIKSMKKSDLTKQQRTKIEAIEELAADIKNEAAAGDDIPKLLTYKNWWKVANLDKFLVRKKKELEQMRISNEEYRNFKKEEGQEKGPCTVM